MAYNESTWGTIGKIPPESDFFDVDIRMSDILDGTGFTMQYSKLLGEQVFKVTEPSELPFTARHTGAPITAGAGWVERLVKRLGAGTTTSGSAKAGVIQRKNPKDVTADDCLRYYDSTGKEFTYDSENLKGWIPVSLPSDLDIYNMFTQKNGFGQLNSMLIDNVKQGYDRALETELQKRAVTCCPVNKDTTLRGKALFTLIRDEVAKMKSDDFAFNFMSSQDNTDYEHKAKDVIIYMNRRTYNAMMDDFAVLPSPQYIKDIGAEFVLMDNEIVTPYASLNAMTTDNFVPKVSGVALTSSTIASKFPNVGKASPDILMMDKRWIEYRPVTSSYRINISKNDAGDFTNEHMHFVGGINIKPWANCESIHLTE